MPPVLSGLPKDSKYASVVAMDMLYHVGPASFSVFGGPGSPSIAPGKSSRGPEKTDRHCLGSATDEHVTVIVVLFVTLRSLTPLEPRGGVCQGVP